ncbi:MAG: hypothetical protein U1E42_08505 [Rhodospirillales bacterium]
MSTEEIDARDVLDVNARTAVNFRARVVGHFRRKGPNSWDNYVFCPVENGETVDVLAAVPIQVESEGADFRMRRHGGVERLAWHPDDDDTSGPDVRARFLAECVRAFSEDQGIGAAAVIASKLCSTPPKTSLD